MRQPRKSGTTEYSQSWKRRLAGVLAGILAVSTAQGLRLSALALEAELSAAEPAAVTETAPAEESPAAGETPVVISEPEPAPEPSPVLEPEPESPGEETPAETEGPAESSPAETIAPAETEGPAEPAPEEAGAEEPAEPVEEAAEAPAEEPGEETPEEPEEEPVKEPEVVAEIEGVQVVDAASVEHEEPGDDEEDAEPEGDPTADVETPAQWRRMFSSLTLTGDWAEDLLAVAKTQLGYVESQRNYIVNDADRHKGYTRYGAWYGCPYGDWCAMFVSFCLNFAGIPASAMPREASCPRWVNALRERDMYVDASDYTPVPGDLIFFNFHGKGADHVGIVYEVDEENGRLVALEGNSGDQVRYVRYDLNDGDILGYGILPQNPARIVEKARPAKSLLFRDGEVMAVIGARPDGVVLYMK